jgi:peptidoglycan/LPS O-acetylase OafA/YrhL
VFFSLFFIGLFECKLISFTKIFRIFADSAYWIYLIHFSIVTFITFFMFKFNFSIELKLMLSILLTTLISYISYKYLVRSTYLGVLLNGKKRKFSWEMFE